MSYSVRISPSARAGIDLLPAPVAAAAVNFIRGQLRTQPEALGLALGGGLKGHRLVERGQYRIVYRVDHAASTIDIMRVTPR